MSSNTSCITRECDAIEMSREQNAAAAGPSVAQVPLQDYFNAWLPKVSELDNRTIDKVAKSVTKKLLGLRARWKSLPRYWDLGRTPKRAALRELGDVVSAIEHAVSRRMPELVQTTQFVVNPTEAPTSVYRELTSRPDLYFVHKDPRRYSPDGTPYWLDVAVTGEFVKECDPEFPTDIYQKVLWNMHHTMREDPRRTRVLAFTIVDRDMRLWFCDRSNAVVTEPFDFTESPGHFVRFVLACLYAPHDQLGWDPTVTSDWNGRAGTQPQYIFTVHSRTNPCETRQFKTLELLFNGARSIRCRATRVWKVKEWKRRRVVGKPMVLKDCWVDSSWEVEGCVVDRIRQSAETDEQKRELDEILLTTVIDGEVLRGDGQIDQTIYGDLRERLIEENTSRLRVAHMSVWITRETGGDSTPRVYRWTVREPAKDHYRIVFKEVCDSLYNINDLSRIFHVLAGACKALQILHSLGWVHRDLSPGNIMVCGNTVKIADFEYAKKMRRRPGKEPDPRLGTAAFRAIEVDVRMFVFTSQDSDSESEPEAPRESTEEQWEKLDQTLPDLESRSPNTLVIRSRRRKFELVEWFHNPLHDMESVFWITLYFLVTYDVFYHPNAASAASCSTKTVDESDSQRARRLGYYADLTNKVFQGGRASQTRYMMVWAPGTLSAYFRAQPLHPAIAPLAGVPIVMLYALIDAYTKAEKDRKNIDRTCAEGVYEVFSAYLAKAQDHLASLECTVLVRPVVEEVRKLREQAMLDAQAAASRKRRNTKRGREGKGKDNHEADTERPKKRQRRVGGPAGDDAPASLRRSARLRKEPAEVDSLNEPDVKVPPSTRRKLPVQHHVLAAAEPGRVLRSGKRRT